MPRVNRIMSFIASDARLLAACAAALEAADDVARAVADKRLASRYVDRAVRQHRVMLARLTPPTTLAGCAALAKVALTLAERDEHRTRLTVAILQFLANLATRELSFLAA